MNNVQEHPAKMLRIVGIERVTARNTEKVWIRIRVWENAVRCSRWDADAGEQRFTTVEEVRENVGVAADDGTKKLTDVHIFTDRADSRSAAVRIAHETHDAARAATEVGLEIPHGWPDGWGACGFRLGWELDWPAAAACHWTSPCCRTKPSNFEL
jgi:hypothetical protein